MPCVQIRRAGTPHRASRRASLSVAGAPRACGESRTREHSLSGCRSAVVRGNLPVNQYREPVTPTPFPGEGAVPPPSPLRPPPVGERGHRLSGALDLDKDSRHVVADKSGDAEGASEAANVWPKSHPLNLTEHSALYVGRATVSGTVRARLTPLVGVAPRSHSLIRLDRTDGSPRGTRAASRRS